MSSIRQQLTTSDSRSHKTPKPNITKPEQAAIDNLRKNSDIHILQTDKGNATVILNKADYNHKIQDLLDMPTYTKLKKNPTPAMERKLNQKLLTLHRQDVLPKQLYFQLRSSSGTCPILFSQPKIHKPTAPLRPIISTRGSPCYNTAKPLASLLQPLVGQSKHHITNSKHFLDTISCTTIQPTDILVSFDVESLFTNVPVDQACDIFKQRLIDADPTLQERTRLDPNQIHDLLLTCLNSTSFRWREDYYKQEQGAAVGSPLSPIIANIFMEHFETQAIQSAHLQSSLWLCYVDNTFVIWPHNREELNKFLQHINQQLQSIKFTMEVEQNNSIPFLDIRVTKKGQGPPTLQVYRKPTHTDRYLHYWSFNHPSVLQSVPNALIRRAHQLSDPDHFQLELSHVTSALTTINQNPRSKTKTRVPSSLCTS